MSLLLPKGFRIEEFQIESPLGVGGFGITYLAYDTKLERRVAIKEYMPEGLIAGRDSESRRPLFRSIVERANYRDHLERFRAEALHIARFNHPNIVPIHRVLAHNETAYIVMEYLGETNLQRLVASGKRPSEAELAQILCGVLDGLGTMHAAGLLHRDVKPSNIMLRPDGTPVLIDFGSARQAHHAGEPQSVRVISEGFSPPEQYDSEGRIGPWSDIFAAAAACYFAMRGAAPVPVLERVLAVMRRQPDPLVPLTKETTGDLYSEPFLAAVSRGLELRERARPQSIPEWAPMFPPPIAGRAFPQPAIAPAAAPTLIEPEPELSAIPERAPAPASSSGEPASLGRRRNTSPTLLADASLRPVRTAHRGRRLPRQAAPVRPRNKRLRLLGQLAALTTLLAAATIGVGVMTQDIELPAAPQLADRSAEPVAIEKRVAAAVPVPAPDPAALAVVQRCDELVAHPDDPGRPKAVRGVEFDAITEAAAREAVEACGAALRADPRNIRAQFNLGRAYQRLARLKPEESADAWRRANEAYAAAARSGYAAAQGNLGQILYGALSGAVVDAREAVEWLRKSATGNFPDAYLTLAHAYSTGRGVEADPHKAYCWFSLARRASSVPAYRALAQQQRAAIGLAEADKRAIEARAARGADCL